MEGQATALNRPPLNQKSNQINQSVTYFHDKTDIKATPKSAILKRGGGNRKTKELSEAVESQYPFHSNVSRKHRPCIYIIDDDEEAAAAVLAAVAAADVDVDYEDDDDEDDNNIMEVVVVVMVMVMVMVVVVVVVMVVVAVTLTTKTIPTTTIIMIMLTLIVQKKTTTTSVRTTTTMVSVIMTRTQNNDGVDDGNTDDRSRIEHCANNDDHNARDIINFIAMTTRENIKRNLSKHRQQVNS